MDQRDFESVAAVAVLAQASQQLRQRALQQTHSWQARQVLLAQQALLAAQQL